MALDHHLHLRLDSTAVQRLDRLAARYGIRRAEVLRLLLTRESDALDAQARGEPMTRFVRGCLDADAGESYASGQGSR